MYIKFITFEGVDFFSVICQVTELESSWENLCVDWRQSEPCKY